jgi:hypothetical protein
LAAQKEGSVTHAGTGDWRCSDLISNLRKKGKNSTSSSHFPPLYNKKNKKQEAKRLCREVVEYVQVRSIERE